MTKVGDHQTHIHQALQGKTAAEMVEMIVLCEILHLNKNILKLLQ